VPESTLSVTITSLRQVVADYLGYSLGSTSWTADQSTRLDMLCKAGLRQFYYPPQTGATPRGFYWKFLVKNGVATTVAATATIALPDDFYMLIEKPCFYNETYTSAQTLEMIDWTRYKQLVEQRGLYQGTPKWFIVGSTTPTDGTANTKWSMAFFPIPQDASYDIVYKYLMLPDYPTVAGGKIYPLGGAAHGNTIESSCLAVAEYRLNGVHGDKWQQFMTDLAGSVSLEGAIMEGPLGGMRDLFAPEGMVTWPASPTLLYNGVPV